MAKPTSIPDAATTDLSDEEFEPPTIDQSDEDDMYDVGQRQAYAPPRPQRGRR
jgi:hypothetical protein